MIRNLSSRGNTRIKLAASLKKTHQCRKQAMYLVEGPRYISDMLERDVQVEFLVLSEEATDYSGEIAQQASSQGLDVLLVPPSLYADVSSTEHSQGLSAAAAIPCHTAASVFNGGTVLVLDGVGDPGNAGTAVRSAAAFNSSGVVFLSGSAYPWNPKVTRASAGLNSSIPIIETASLVPLVEEFPGYRFLGADAEGEPFSIETGSAPLCIVTGSEAHGLSSATRSCITGSVSIPMKAGVESLNAGVSASILLYDLFRRKL